jgi:hypothetical protein
MGGGWGKNSKLGVLGHKRSLGVISFIFVQAKRTKIDRNFVKALNKTEQSKKKSF